MEKYINKNDLMFSKQYDCCLIAFFNNHLILNNKSNFELLIITENINISDFIKYLNDLFNGDIIDGFEKIIKYLVKINIEFLILKSNENTEIKNISKKNITIMFLKDNKYLFKNIHKRYRSGSILIQNNNKLFNIGVDNIIPKMANILIE
jgi:hypothetical protein